jgi:hypothetical protein
MRCESNATCPPSGDLVPDAVAAECLASSKALHVQVLAWMKAHRPDLLLD